MRIYLFNKDEKMIGVKGQNDLIEAHLVEQVNAGGELTFSLPNVLPKEVQKICIPSPVEYYSSSQDAMLLFKIITEDIKTDRVEYTCVEYAYDELKSCGYIKDLRPKKRTAKYMMDQVLKDTNWSVGENKTGSDQASTNFYYKSILNCIQDITKLFGIEIRFNVKLDGNKIKSKKVNMYLEEGHKTGEHFEYGSNALEVEKETSSDEIYTALVGRGKGEEVDGDNNPDTANGYGRKITFADITWSKAKGDPLDKPKGQEYLEDPKATAKYGLANGKPRIGFVEFQNDTDKKVLLQHTYQKLKQSARPQVQFKASVIDVGTLYLGDTVTIIRRDMGISYQTRVFKIDHDLLDDANNTVEFGDNLSEKDLDMQLSEVKKEVDGIKDEVDNYTDSSMNDPSDLDDVNDKMDDLQDDFDDLQDGLDDLGDQMDDLNDKMDDLQNSGNGGSGGGGAGNSGLKPEDAIPAINNDKTGHKIQRNKIEGLGNVIDAINNDKTGKKIYPEKIEGGIGVYADKLIYTINNDKTGHKISANMIDGELGVTEDQLIESINNSAAGTHNKIEGFAINSPIFTDGIIKTLNNEPMGYKIDPDLIQNGVGVYAEDLIETINSEAGNAYNKIEPSSIKNGVGVRANELIAAINSDQSGNKIMPFKIQGLPDGAAGGDHGGISGSGLNRDDLVFAINGGNSDGRLLIDPNQIEGGVGVHDTQVINAINRSRNNGRINPSQIEGGVGVKPYNVISAINNEGLGHISLSKIEDGKINVEHLSGEMAEWVQKNFNNISDTVTVGKDNIYSQNVNTSSIMPTPVHPWDNHQLWRPFSLVHLTPPKGAVPDKENYPHPAVYCEGTEVHYDSNKNVSEVNTGIALGRDGIYLIKNWKWNKL